MATLSRELGPADTKIDLEVDTLKYDVGVFALGALGTGIFLFVNTLVGGLLTLAAPILAVVLKERVAGEIKAQAKKNAPEVIDEGGGGGGAALRADRRGLRGAAVRLRDRGRRRAPSRHRRGARPRARRAAGAGRRRRGARAGARRADGAARARSRRAWRRCASDCGHLRPNRPDRRAARRPDRPRRRARARRAGRGLSRSRRSRRRGQRARRAPSSCGPIIRARSTCSASPTRGAATTTDAIGGARAGGDGAARGRRSPGFAEAWLALADVHRRRGDDDAAIDAYRAALDAGVGDSAMRAEIYRGLGASTCASDGTTRRCASCARRWRRRPTTPRRRGCSGARSICKRRLRHGARLPRARGAGGAARSARAGVARRSVRAARARRRRARRLRARAGARGERRATCRSRRGWAWRGWRWRRAIAQAARSEALRALERDPARPDILTHAGARLRRRAAVGRRARRLRSRARRWRAAERGQRGQLHAVRSARAPRGGAARGAARGRDGARDQLRDRAAGRRCPSIPTRWRRRRARPPTAASSSARRRSSSARWRRATPSRRAWPRPTWRSQRGQPAQAAASLRRAAQLAPDRSAAARAAGRGLSRGVAGDARRRTSSTRCSSQAHRLFARTRELAELQPGGRPPRRGARSPAAGHGDGRVQLGQVDLRQRAHRRGGRADGHHADDGDHQRA